MVVVTAKNLTSMFLKYKNEFKNKKNRFGVSILDAATSAALNTHFCHGQKKADLSGQQRLLSCQSDDENVGMEMTAKLPPVWVDVVEEIRDEINRIKEKMGQLQRVQQRRLLKVFQSNNFSQPEDETFILSDSITNLFKQCEQNIMRILPAPNSVGYSSYIQNLSKYDLNLRQNAQKNVANKLRCLSITFRKQQKLYLKEMRKRTNGITDGFETASTQSTADPGFSDDLLMEIDNVEVDVHSRNEELAKIAQSVTELHNLFKDLSTLVIEQGTILDRIDYNVEQVSHEVRQANVQLLKAEKCARSARAEKCIVFLITLIFILLIMFVFKYAQI